MFSKFQTSHSALTNAPQVDNWVSKIFPGKSTRKRKLNHPEQREYFRLDMEDLPSLDATLISKNGDSVDFSIINLSAGGVCGEISHALPFFENQWLTVAFVLPFEEPLLVKTSACLIDIETNGHPKTKILHLEFSAGLDDWQKELIHVYVLKKQFELIRRRKRWQIF